MCTVHHFNFWENRITDNLNVNLALILWWFLRIRGFYNYQKFIKDLKFYRINAEGSGIFWRESYNWFSCFGMLIKCTLLIDSQFLISIKYLFYLCLIQPSTSTFYDLRTAALLTMCFSTVTIPVSLPPSHSFCCFSYCSFTCISLFRAQVYCLLNGRDHLRNLPRYPQTCHAFYISGRVKGFYWSCWY